MNNFISIKNTFFRLHVVIKKGILIFEIDYRVVIMKILIYCNLLFIVYRERFSTKNKIKK